MNPPQEWPPPTLLEVSGVHWRAPGSLLKCVLSVFWPGERRQERPREAEETPKSVEEVSRAEFQRSWSEFGAMLDPRDLEKPRNFIEK